MFSFSRVATAFAVALTLSSGVYSIGQIARTGRYLYASDGSRFFMKGVAYQPQGEYHFFQDFFVCKCNASPRCCCCGPQCTFL
jgi:hypothetical protein